MFGPYFLRVLISSACGTFIGSFIFSTILAAYTSDKLPPSSNSFLGGIVFPILFGFIPVFLVTGLAGPIATRIAMRDTHIDVTRYFAIATAILAVPWLAMGAYFAPGAILAISGYPTAAVYLGTFLRQQAEDGEF